jgi:hypothetical protein
MPFYLVEISRIPEFFTEPNQALTGIVIALLVLTVFDHPRSRRHK